MMERHFSSSSRNFHITESKIKERLPICTQITHAVKDKNFDALLDGIRKAVWEVFKVAVDKFLGKHKASIYSTLV
jgi:hypothetical protein